MTSQPVWELVPRRAEPWPGEREREEEEERERGREGVREREKERISGPSDTFSDLNGDSDLFVTLPHARILPR
jgi:hypothetical protein